MCSGLNEGNKYGFFFSVSAMPDEGVISPAELAVLDSLMNGGFALSLKVQFSTGKITNGNVYNSGGFLFENIL